LAYDVLWLGDPADIKADIAAIVSEDQKQQEEWEKTERTFPYSRYRLITDEPQAVANVWMTSLKVCFLLRIGETSVAEKYWSQVRADRENEVEDPYLLLVNDWTWCVFARAIGAHLRGDDQLALADARLLTKAFPLLETAAAQRGFKRPMTSDWREFHPNVPLLGFLDLPALLADEERRVKRIHKPLLLEESLKIMDQSKRIDALILKLEDVAETQWSNPGDVFFNHNPIVIALTKEGAAAIEPLLHCLETDKRLTRSVDERWDLFDVPSAAYAALVDILQLTDLRYHRPPKDRKLAAEQIRAVWEKKTRKSALPPRPPALWP
jgi:hypothetical protein